MNFQATGVETGSDAQITSSDSEIIVERVLPKRQHLRLTQITFQAQTDGHNELVHESEWLLHPSERNLRLRGNLFVLEDPGNGEGWIFIKEGPLPEERAVRAAADLAFVSGSEGHEVHLLAHADEAGRYPWTVLGFEGGRRGCTRVLHHFQASRRAGHLPEFLTNTWGDRSQDSRIRHEFMIEEIAAAARLGADVVQIDDGWQTGMTSNSASAKQGEGSWGNFASSRADFWAVHPERFPQGLAPLVEEARAHGVALGLWFAPDSTDDYALHNQDAEVVLNLFRKLGVRHFKIDGVRTVSALGEDRLAPLVALWREYRAELANGDILTIGKAPDGWAWTGFASVDSEDRHMHLLVFRECNPSESTKLPLPTSNALRWEIQKISGNGSAKVGDENDLVVQIPELRNYVWVRLSRVPA